MAQYVYGSKSNVPDLVLRDGKTYRVISDQLGSPVLAVNVADAGDVPFRAEYAAFGEVTGTGVGWMALGFAGGLYDAETGLVRFGARDYEPQTGRWVSKDPILWDGEQSNLYEHVGGDAVNSVDASGLSKFDKLYDLPKKFWRWYHRQMKDPGDPDLGRDEAEQLCDEWRKAGKPGPDNKRGSGDWDDWLDFFIPFPDIPDSLLFPHSYPPDA